MQTALRKAKGTGMSVPMREIEALMEANHLHLCLECGKCSAVCPMVNFYGEYVHNRCARSVVERLSFDPEDIDDEALWYCWACKECTFFCPSGVDFQNFMTGFRQLLVSRGYIEYAHFCGACGSYMMPRRQLEYLEATLHPKGNAELLYECPNCKKGKYIDALFKLARGGGYVVAHR
jgi:heterodisulfide reductase subunit C